MSTLLQINLIISCILLLAVVFYNIIRSNLQVKYSLIWIFSSVLFLIIAVFPPIAGALAKAAGVQLSSNIVFMIMNIFLYLVTFSFTVAISKLNAKMKKIAQEVGLLKEEIEQLKKTVSAIGPTPLCDTADTKHV